MIRLWFDSEPGAASNSGMFSGDFVMHNFFWLKNYEPYKKWHEGQEGLALRCMSMVRETVLAQPDAILITNVITDFYRAFPELKGHLIAPYLQRNAATHTLPEIGARGTHSRH